jgi:hypothetical protein
MPFVNGFEASIFVKETEVLPAYGVVIDEFNRTLTCWIPSEANRVRLDIFRFLFFRV